MKNSMKKNWIIGLCSIGGVILAAGAALAVLLECTRQSLVGLDFSDDDFDEIP